MVQPFTGILVGTKMEKQQNSDNKDLYFKECYEHAKMMLRQIDLDRDKGVIKPTDSMDRQRYQKIIDSYIAYLQEKATTVQQTQTTTSTQPQERQPQQSLVSFMENSNAKTPEEHEELAKAAAEDKLCLALANDLCSLKKPVDPIHWPAIEVHLRQLIMGKLLDDNTNKPIPRFEKCGIYKGFLLVHCNDNYTKDVLNNCIAKIQNMLWGMRLVFIRGSRINFFLERAAKRKLREENKILNSTSQIVATNESEPKPAALVTINEPKKCSRPSLNEIPREELRYRNARDLLGYLLSIPTLNENQLSKKRQLEEIVQEYRNRFIKRDEVSLERPIKEVYSSSSREPPQNEVNRENSIYNTNREPREHDSSFVSRTQQNRFRMYQENEHEGESNLRNNSSRSTTHQHFDQKEYDLPSSSRSRSFETESTRIPQFSNYDCNSEYRNDLERYYPSDSQQDCRDLVSRREQQTHQSAQNYLRTHAELNEDSLSDGNRRSLHTERNPSSNPENFYSHEHEMPSSSRKQRYFTQERENYEHGKGLFSLEEHNFMTKNPFRSPQEESLFDRRSEADLRKYSSNCENESSREKSKSSLEKQIFEFLKSFDEETPVSCLKRKLETLKRGNNPNTSESEVITLSDDESDADYQMITNDYYKAIDYLRGTNARSASSFSDAEKLNIEMCRHKIEKYNRMLKSREMETRPKRSSNSSTYSSSLAKRRREEPRASPKTPEGDYQKGFWKSGEDPDFFKSFPVDTTPRQSNNDLEIAIVDRNNRDLKISSDSWSKIQKRLLEHLAEEMDRTGNVKIGMFNGSYWQHGFKIVQCENLESLNFIKRSIYRQDIYEPSLQLDIIPAKELPHRSVVKVSIPSTSLDDNAVLKILKSQNLKLYSEDWTLINGRDSHNKLYRDLYISVSSTSLERLKSKKGEVRYGTNTLKMVLADDTQLK